MEEDDYGSPATPFWLRSDSNNTYFRRSRSSSSTSSNLGGRALAVTTQVFFLAAGVFLLFFFIIPPFASTASQIFRPHLVRKSWDYLNFVLVLFAIVCGCLSRSSDSNENKNDRSISSSYEYGYGKYSRSSSLDRGRISTAATPRHWYDDRGGDRFSDQIVYNRFSRLRSSSSYPDLRLREPDEDERWRFHDDTRVYGYRIDGPDRLYQSYGSWREDKPAEDEDRTTGDGGGSVSEKKVEVDAAVAEPQRLDGSVKQLRQSSSPSHPPAPPSPPLAPASPPPSKPVRRRTKRVYRDVAIKTERREGANPVVEASQPPPQPPPPPAIASAKTKKNEKKRGGTTKDFLIALRRKKKKQRQKSVDGLDLLFGSDPPSANSQPPQSPPRPPPPPPPPPPFFHGLFSSKKGKNKRNYSTPAPSAPAPPPQQQRVESRASTVRTPRAPLESHASKPNPSAKVTAFNRRDEIVATGNESPLLPIPPPPPPPPFKIPVWKFVVQGDFARMASDISSRSDSLDLDESEDPERFQSEDGDTPASTDGNSPAARLFCPSPDVDTKADNFIARFRAGLRLEKMNSVNQRTGRSNLGPEPEPETEPETELEPESLPYKVQSEESGR